MELLIPHNALILGVGAAGAGKSTFYQRHFLPHQVVSSDEMRRLVCGDARQQSVSGAAFEVFHLLIEKRLELGHLTVADATNLEPKARHQLLSIARDVRVPAVVLYFQTSLRECEQNNWSRRRVRYVPEYAIHRQWNEAVQARIRLPKEGFDAIYDVNPAVEYTVKPTYPEFTREACEEVRARDAGGHDAFPPGGREREGRVE